MNSKSRKSNTKNKEKWSKKDFLPFSTPIITFIIAIIAFWQATISNRATNATLRQVIAFEESQAAILDVFNPVNVMNKIRWKNNIKLTFKTEIANASMVAAKNIKTQSRVDFLKKDFDNDIIYEINSLKKQPPLTHLGEIIIEDTIETVFKIAEIDTTTKWAFLHIRAIYDNGFGKEKIRNWGFRFDIRTEEKYRCKHNN